MSISIESLAAQLAAAGQRALDTPAFEELIVRNILPQYEQWIKQYQPFLEAKGRVLVRQGLNQYFKVASESVPGSSTPPSGNTWMKRFYEPVLEPVKRGALDEVKKFSKPIVIGGVTLFLGSLFAAYQVGKWRQRRLT